MTEDPEDRVFDQALEEPEEDLLELLDGPRIALGAFAFFMVGLLILSLLLWNEQRKQIERIDDLQQNRIMQEQTAKKVQVETCFSRAAQTPPLNRLLRALQAEIDNPAVRADIKNYRELVALNTPTFRQCRELADRLNVPVPTRSIR